MGLLVIQRVHRCWRSTWRSFCIIPETATFSRRSLEKAAAPIRWRRRSQLCGRQLRLRSAGQLVLMLPSSHVPSLLIGRWMRLRVGCESSAHGP